MYIEFRIPNGGGLAPPYALHFLKKELEVWKELHGIPYTEKTVKFSHRVCFDKPEDYSFFLMSWEPKSNTAKSFKVIDIP
jgi:hypothetical protein